ncbi:MAG: hypothetical protein E7577_06350 [Ruminococcaceae bacterium]|nr:hypothetical protein [Oscillospiraceae bacterium]
MKRFINGIVCGFMAFSIALGASYPTLASAKESDTAPLSPALSVLAEDGGMALAGLVGKSISFEAEDFARALNLSSISSITITEAPPISDGELRVGNTVLNSGQTVSAASISLMTYVPASSVTKSSFRFSVEGSGYDVPCELYMLSSINYAPTLSEVPKSYLEVSTHRNITLYGTLPCHDPEGDATVVEIVSYPQSGYITLTDKANGEYTYTPNAGYSGKDSFTYVARDVYGNYSAARTVSLTVSKPTVNASFDDMKNSPAYNAALTMLEEGVMSGTQVGSDTYFYPDGTVTRGEFVAMTLRAIDINDVADKTSTVFADDSSIPSHMKGYIATAYELGYVKGIDTENGRCFEASRAITKAEAAVILGNILNVEIPTVLPTFKDASDIPAWAAPSVYSLNSIGVMSATDGNIAPTASLTRADAAILLANLINYLD